MAHKRTLLLVLVLFGMGGCIVEDNTPVNTPPASVDIELDITFNGGLSCTDAGVDHVTITFAGGVLPSTTVPCAPGPVVAVDYPAVDVGNYTATITGADVNDNPLYAGQGNFDVTISGPSTFALDIPPAM